LLLLLLVAIVLVIQFLTIPTHEGKTNTVKCEFVALANNALKKRRSGWNCTQERENWQREGEPSGIETEIEHQFLVSQPKNECHV
jgi:hypothetical protein